MPGESVLTVDTPLGGRAGIHRQALEFACPASDEMGHRTTCERCQLCRGTSSPARSVAIVVHGKPSSLKAFGIHVPFFVKSANGTVEALA
jgi:hypothetical protein